MEENGENLVHLAASGSQFQKFAIEEALKAAGIAYAIRDHGAPKVYTGEGMLLYQEFVVPESRLQEAKDALCANGIVCEVSEHLLRRALEEIVKPIMGCLDPDLSRLTHFVEVNNKETVKALFQEALKLEGGRGLLDDLFFRIDRPEDIPCLRTLARVLGPEADAAFWARLEEMMRSGEDQPRLALLEVLPELPEIRRRAEILAIALRDPSLEIRDTASEALFALGKGDYGYNPEDPEDERESAIANFLALHG
jgi:hypothetical protein